MPPERLPEILEKLKQETQKTIYIWDLFLVGCYTLLRPNEYCSMQWDWIHDGYIEVPAEVMKMKRSHRVPISTQLRVLLDQRKIKRIDEYVFSNMGRPIGTSALEKFLRRHGFKDVLVPHGIRSIGRTWMRENKIEHDVAEMCLAHLVSTATERAYNRTDLLDERAVAMQAWCDYVESCFKS